MEWLNQAEAKQFFRFTEQSGYRKIQVLRNDLQCGQVWAAALFKGSQCGAGDTDLLGKLRERCAAQLADLS